MIPRFYRFAEIAGAIFIWFLVAVSFLEFGIVRVIQAVRSVRSALRNDEEPPDSIDPELPQ